MDRFTGRTVVITGVASGIGRDTAVRFAAEGAHVVGADINESGGEETGALCRDVGGKMAFVLTDVTKEIEVARLISHAVSVSGSVDILFNNAGAGGTIGPIENTPADDWDRTFDIVLKSVMFGIKHVVPQMKAQGRGAIISTSSDAGERGFAYSHAYCSAKAGIINLTRSAAIELAPFGIRVNCVSPGAIATPMQYSKTGPELDLRLAKHQPIGRPGRGTDVAGAVLYLASDDAEWVTGQSIGVDGGATLGVWNYEASVNASAGPLKAESKHKGQNEAKAQPATTFLGPSFLCSGEPG